ncbi:MAG: HlyD family efflux transporter periplasmic adaptor subunit [Telmatospirillum sp.]|nr:HlyD family efflux transporter periplasmic adaptor subunit [Telmatospirillum sp.]
MDRPSRRRSFVRRNARGLGVAVLGLLSGVYGYVHYGLERRIAIDARQLVISAVARGQFHDYVPVTGSVQPEISVYLDVAQGGQIADRLVEEGAMVEAGQPLVRLRNASLEMQVTSDEAQLAERLFQLSSVNLQMEDARLQHQRDLAAVDAGIAATTLQLGRLRPLLAQGFARRADVEDAEVRLERYRQERKAVAEARELDIRTRSDQIRQLTDAMDQLRRNHEMAQRNLDDLTVRAPISGQLTSLDAESGAFKTPGQRIGQIDRQGAFKVVAPVDEFYLSQIAPGQKASVDIDGQTYSLRVSKVHPEVRNRQFSVDLLFDSAPPTLRRGQTLQLRLEVGAPTDGLTLANGAFFPGAGEQWAWVVSAPGDRADRRRVIFGRHNPLSVEVLGGLAAGDRVITSSYADFKALDILDIRGTAGAGEAKR